MCTEKLHFSYFLLSKLKSGKFFTFFMVLRVGFFVNVVNGDFTAIQGYSLINHCVFSFQRSQWKSSQNPFKNGWLIAFIVGMLYLTPL